MTTSTAEDDILVALLRGPKKKGMTVTEVHAATGRADSTVRGNLDNLFGLRWVGKLKDGPAAAHFMLTDHGREVARNRAKSKKRAAKA